MQLSAAVRLGMHGRDYPLPVATSSPVPSSTWRWHSESGLAATTDAGRPQTPNWFTQILSYYYRILVVQMKDLPGRMRHLEGSVKCLPVAHISHHRFQTKPA